MRLFCFLIGLTMISSASAQTGCIGGLINQFVNNGEDNSNEVANQKIQIQMKSAQQFFENRKQCRTDLADAQIKLLEAQDEFNKKQRLAPVELKKAKIAYKESLLQLKRDCDATARDQFGRYRTMMDNDNVVTVREGGPQSLVGRTKKINRHRKLFYDDCLAQEINVEAVQLQGEKLAANLEEINVNLENAAESLANITQRLTLKQRETIEICKMADEVLSLNKKNALQIASNSNAQSKNNGVLGIIGAIGNCISGPQDATGSSTKTQSTN